MNTTDVFVEQVLVGGMVLAVIALFSWEWTLGVFAAQGGIGQAIITSGLVVAVAYLVGIIADRVIDTILGEAESWNKLLFSLGPEGRKECEGDDQPNEDGEGEEDEFPIGKLRNAVMGEAGRAAHADYLRTRMRLTRAIAVLSPALTTAWFVGQTRSIADREFFGALLALFYLLAWVLPTFVTPRLARCREFRSTSWFLIRVPATSEVGKEARKQFRNNRNAWRLEPILAAVFAAVLLLQGYAVLTAPPPQFRLLPPDPPMSLSARVGLAGFATLFPLISFWAWRRISKTFYIHIQEAGKRAATQRLGWPLR